MASPRLTRSRSALRLSGSVGVFSTGYDRVQDPVIGREAQNILFAGVDNALYQRARLLIARNSMASQCADKLRKFTAGQGLQGPAADYVINESRESVADFHRQVCAELAWYNGVAIRVMFTPDGLKERYRIIPFQNFRYTMEGMISIWGNWGGERDFLPDRGGQPDTYFPYDLSKFAEQAEAYGGGENHPGQVYVMQFWQYMSADYPMPPCFPAMTDMDSGAELQVLRNNLIKQGFHQGSILLLSNKLQPDEASKISQRIARMQGSRGAGGCTVIDGVGDVNENPFKSFDRTDTEGSITASRADLNESSRTADGVHPALLDHSKGWSSDEIALAFTLFNMETQERRAFVASELAYLFSDAAIPGIESQSFEVAPLVFIPPSTTPAP